MEEKFEWSGTLSAPDEYPVEVYEGMLVSENFTQYFKDWGIVNPGWGTAGGTVVIGPDLKTIPSRLEITWLSLVENKFYSGQFDLPKEKIVQMFKQGFLNDQNEKETYDTIIAGLAPGGTVVIWLMAAGRQVEVAKFQAHNIQIDPAGISENDKYMFEAGYNETVLSSINVLKPATKEKIATVGYTGINKYGDTYRIKYNWKPSILLPAGGKLMHFTATLYNGEMEKLAGELLATADYTPRAIPVRCNIYWISAQNKDHGARVSTFDEKEILNAFKGLGSEKVQLVLEVADDTSVKIYLKTESGSQVQINNANIKTQ
ncbi:MAG TPA: DUF2931 family protein [Flavobacterium sp.]|jgi:hypothetical protein